LAQHVSSEEKYILNLLYISKSKNLRSSSQSTFPMRIIAQHSYLKRSFNLAAAAKNKINQLL